eukprot:TRINITY_DN3682_c1_g1_i1.p1 TRINITY_DN3682_c1_g1~~TRINITY_DN3682_c1_g1_i1.p1  ORF type:complete len:510 (+),score=198.59 TRINITY_DN3682_c1_g1_i1:74-1531(+)
MAEVRNPYLHKHQLPELLDALMRRLLAVQPADPIRFLIGDLVNHERDKKKRQVAAESAERAKRPTTAAVSCDGSLVTDDSIECWDYPSLKGCCSEMAKVLTPELYKELCHERTSHGASVDNVIQVGIDVREHVFAHSAGCAAADAECYITFRPLLEPVIRRQHREWQGGSHPDEDLQVMDLADRAVMPSEHVLLTVASLDRSLADCSFPCAISRGTRRLVASAVDSATSKMPAESGRWCDAAEVQRLLNECSTPEAAVGAPYLPPVPRLLLPPLPLRSEYDKALHLTRDWPDGRGVWLSEDGKFAVWANVYEHLHCRVVGEGGDMYRPLKRMFAAAESLRDNLTAQGFTLARDPVLGSLVSNPTNVGNSFACTALISIPMLCVHQRFDQVLERTGLASLTAQEIAEATYFGLPRSAAASEDHPRLSGAAAHHSELQGTCWVRLGARVGLSESQAAARFVGALHRLIELERLLQKGQHIEIAIGIE